MHVQLLFVLFEGSFALFMLLTQNPFPFRWEIVNTILFSKIESEHLWCADLKEVWLQNTIEL